MGYLIGLLLIPVLSVVYEVIALCKSLNDIGKKRKTFIIDIVIQIVGVFFTKLYLEGVYSMVNVPWNEVVYNSQIHQVLNGKDQATIITFASLYLIFILMNGILNVNKMPPLLSVFMLSGLYIGPVLIIVFTIHAFLGQQIFDVMLLILPLCTCLTSIRMMFEQVTSFKVDERRTSKTYHNSFLRFLNKLLLQSKTWPLLAILALVPVLLVVICILVLFGQAPDAAIKAFTETADWNLSQKVGPQNLYYDEHYLCTVAAGGHKSVVKPIRKGVRHGHEVCVNRQLQIANAFEQILEDYTPGFHKALRYVYDKYGLPVARLIKRKWIADFVWFLMKPLEWFFLIILYLVDRHPEDRICIQYTGKHYKEFVKD